MRSLFNIESYGLPGVIRPYSNLRSPKSGKYCMPDSPFQIIETELVKCVKSLLSYYSSVPEDEIVVAPSSLADISQKTMLCSSIGLAGDEFKLSIVILASSATIQPLCPLPNPSTADWIGELANQLIGRMKNALITYGHSGQITLPVTVSGAGMTLYDETAHPATFCAHTAAGDLLVRLEALVDLQSVWEPTEDTSTAEEGSMCLF